MPLAQLLDVQLNSPFDLASLPKPNQPRYQVDIQFLNAPPPEFAAQDYPYANNLGQRSLFFWPHEAVYLSSFGNRLDIFPLGEIQPKLFELSIIGPVLCSLLHQQGRVPLHGSAVAKDGRAHVFLGDQGMGKSTLAAFFVSRGYEFLSDDVILIDELEGVPHVFPCYPSMKLDSHWVKRYGWEGEPLSSIHPSLSKWRVCTKHCFAPAPYPLASLNFLHDASVFSVNESSPSEAYVELLRTTHTAKWLPQSKQAQAHMEQCRPWILECPHLHRIDYPHQQESLESLLNLVKSLP